MIGKMPTSILYDWVMNLGLREQGILLAAIRGCDGMAKEDTTKSIMRELRGLILVPYDPRELEASDKGFMVGFPSRAVEESFPKLLKSLDQYPVHFLFHMLFAMEVIGFRHPLASVRIIYHERYTLIVRKLHLNPETFAQYQARVEEDRIANNTVE